MTQFFEQLGGLGPWLYILFGGLAFAEAAFLLGMVLPGETALLVAGFLARHHVLNVGVMGVVAVIGAIAGDSVGYAFGERYGLRLRSSKVGRWVGEARWQRGDAFLRKHGGKAVFIGRRTALMRAIVPSMAGMAKIPYLRTFLPWNIAGGVLWGAGCVILGYVFAASLSSIERYIGWASWPILAAIVMGVAVFEVRRRPREKRENKAYGPERRADPPSSVDRL